MNMTLIAAGLRLIADGLESVKTQPAPQPVAPQPVAPQPVAPQPVAPQPAAQGLYAGTTTPKPPEVSKEDVVTRFVAVMQSHGQDAIVGLLKARGLSRVSDATPEQLSMLYQDAGAML